MFLAAWTPLKGLGDLRVFPDYTLRTTVIYF